MNKLEWFAPSAVSTPKCGANIKTSPPVVPALSARFAHRGSERQAVYQLPDECKLFSGASGEVTLE
jgi:hypothetical protein